MNLINVIQPYRYLDMWVFDDPRVGLTQEPFVACADTMIDRAVAEIPNAEQGFADLRGVAVSRPPIPTGMAVVDGSGNWYCTPQFDMEGWLCPALLRYFDTAPKELFVGSGRLHPMSSFSCSAVGCMQPLHMPPRMTNKLGGFAISWYK